MPLICYSIWVPTQIDKIEKAVHQPIAVVLKANSKRYVILRLYLDKCPYSLVPAISLMWSHSYICICPNISSDYEFISMVNCSRLFFALLSLLLLLSLSVPGCGQQSRSKCYAIVEPICGCEMLKAIYLYTRLHHPAVVNWFNGYLTNVRNKSTPLATMVVPSYTLLLETITRTCARYVSTQTPYIIYWLLNAYGYIQEALLHISFTKISNRKCYCFSVWK